MVIVDRTVLTIVVAVIRTTLRTVDNIIDKFESNMIFYFLIEWLKLLYEVIGESIK